MSDLELDRNAPELAAAPGASGLDVQARASGLAAAARLCRDDLLRLGDDLAADPCAEIIEAPAAGSVMVQLDTAVGEFCLAEVVVTTASVVMRGAVGWGCVLGWDEQAAVAAALCDAAATAEVDGVAARALELEAAARRREEAAMASTRVALA